MFSRVSSTNIYLQPASSTLQKFHRVPLNITYYNVVLIYLYIIQPYYFITYSEEVMCSPVHICLLVGRLVSGITLNYGSEPRTDPITFWCRSRQTDQHCEMFKGIL